jgi:hypothetical protein
MKRLSLERARPSRTVLVLFAMALWSSGCDSDTSSTASPSGHEPKASKVLPPAPWADRTDTSGISFEHDDGHDGKSWRVVETVNGGLALADFDGDGRLDIYLTNGRPIDLNGKSPRNALYRNLGDWKFEDVSQNSRADDPRFSLGVTVADVDGDGDRDLYVTNWGPNRLYVNDGAGQFEDRAEQAGLALATMNSGATFFDMEGDGDLDLYVATYVQDNQKVHEPTIVRGVPGYWPPLKYPAAKDHLFENLGNGTFRDSSEKSGIRSVEAQRGLGVLASDFSGDGHPDLFVANDLGPNFLFINDGKGAFTEEGLLSGAALGDGGDALGSMGVDAGDFDRDGATDLVVTNYQSQTNNLYRALSAGSFVEMGGNTGFARGSLPEVSWGVGFQDFDLDTRVDVYVANGHLNPFIKSMDDGGSFEQTNRLFRNVDGRGFEVVPASGPLAVRQVSRGAAFGDIDNDGDMDIVVLNLRGKPQLLENLAAPQNARVRIELVGAGLNRDGIGARVTVVSAGVTQMQERRSSASYLSANAPELIFGLGTARSIERIEVRWRSGVTQTHAKPPVNSRLRLVEKTGSLEVLPRQ